MEWYRMISEIHQNIPPQFECTKCNFTCSKQSDYNRHLATRKHNMIIDDNRLDIGKPKLKCESCMFICSKQSDYDRHLQTTKHQKNASKNAQCYNCICGSTYKYSSGYSRHKKVCNFIIPTNNQPLYQVQQVQQLQPQPQKPDTSELYAIIQLLISQNNTMVEQNKTLAELVKNQQPTTNNSHNNNNNQNYNINMFLTDKCKDAQNMSDFIEVLKNKVDMIQIYEKGYVGGISKLFIDELRSMEITERPIHCTDERRNTFYVHNNDTWNKDEDLKDTKKAISHISQTNLQQCVAWSKNVPEGGASREEHITRSIRLCKEACSGDDSKVDKIIKNISKEIPLNKQVINDVLV